MSGGTTSSSDEHSDTDNDDYDADCSVVESPRDAVKNRKNGLAAMSSASIPPPTQTHLPHKRFFYKLEYLLVLHFSVIF